MKKTISNKKSSRLEFKYILDPLTYIKVRDFVESIGLSHDKNAPINPYPVTSLYFDSWGLDDYYDKAGGFMKRKKVRIRVYTREFNEEVKEVNFEIKNKYDMFVSKDNFPVSQSSWQKIIESNFEKLPKKFGYYIFEEGKIPSVIVRYQREAFDSWFYDRVRITFDKDIEAIRPNRITDRNDLWYDAIPVSGSKVILEIKFSDRLPWWFKFMVYKYNLERRAYSKYASAIDALYKYDPLPR